MAKYIEQFWRAATPADAIRETPMVARYRSERDGTWEYGKLVGYRHHERKWMVDEILRNWTKECEVYAEPGWHKNKPDPGEGYRLLQKFPEPEGLVNGDEFLAMNGQWSAVIYCGEIPQHFAVWYRRKIEPAAVTEAKAEPIMAEFEVAAPADSKIGECVMHCVGDEEALGAAIVDPGEGFRLIHTSEETPMAGDEFYSLQENCWKPRKDHNAPFNMLGCYRRKEEPVKERVKFVAHPMQKNDKGEWLFQGRLIQDRSYAVLNQEGHYLQWVDAPEFSEKFSQAFAPGQLRKVRAGLLQGIRLRAVEPVDVDKLKQEIRQELQLRAVEPTPTYETGKVYEHNGRKFRLAAKGDEGYAVFGSNIGLPDALQGVARRLISVRAENFGFKRYQLGTCLHFQYAFIEVTEPPQPQQPKYVPFEWKDRELLRNRYIRRDEDPDRERLILEIVRWMDGTVEVKCRDKSICVSELLRDYVFDDGTPCGKRVEQ